MVMAALAMTNSQPGASATLEMMPGVADVAGPTASSFKGQLPTGLHLDRGQPACQYRDTEQTNGDQS